MGRKAFPHCKVPGCTGERHKYPNGTTAAYCDAHLRLRSHKQRDGLPVMTGEMERTLLHLRECKAAGWKFVELNPTEFNGRTLRILAQRDWVFISDDTDGRRVSITGRGNEALEVYLPVLVRHDGICPTCRLRPRRIRKSGNVAPYCAECERTIQGEKNARLRRQPEYTERPCCHCHQRPRYRHEGGLGSSMCRECDNERARKRNARQRREAAERARAGVVKLCVRCGLRPRKAFENSVSHYCEKCNPVMIRKWKLARMLRARGMGT